MEHREASTFADLYRNHAGAVYRFALYLSGDPPLAEDIVSETFLRVWDSTVEVHMETVRGYLFAIARNLFLHELRRRRRQDRLEDCHLVEAPAPRELEAREDLRETLATLMKLPESSRAALLLRAHEGLSYEEIARILGISLTAVKVKIHRARLLLAEHRKGPTHASH
jgi:RNA polymerase sigma-70 factor (ECF subfamily)